MKDFGPNYKPSLHFRGIGIICLLFSHFPKKSYNFLIVHGTDVFDRGRVVYATPMNNDDLVTFTKFTCALHEKFQREGFVDNEEFKLHATLMKLRRKTIIKRIDGKKKEV